MSYIIGGGGGGGGLTEAEVKALIGRGEANGTAGLSSFGNLILPGNNIAFNDEVSVPSDIYLSSKLEQCFRLVRTAANNYKPEVNLSKWVKLLDASDRNGATSTGVAAIYNPCKTLYNEHRPVCTKEYHLTGKYLDGADNPDVWFPIKGGGVGASVSYANRVLTLNSGSGTISASRCVIDQTKFPITGNFAEVTFELDHVSAGEGGVRRIAVGFQPAFSAYAGNDSDRAVFFASGSDWYIGFTSSGSPLVKVSELPLGRNLQKGDICTVRLDRQEGSSNIDIVRFYVNGQKQYETTGIPTVDVYAGIGAFNTNSLVDVGCEIGIKYFGVRYVP